MSHQFFNNEKSTPMTAYFVIEIDKKDESEFIERQLLSAFCKIFDSSSACRRVWLGMSSSTSINLAHAQIVCSEMRHLGISSQTKVNKWQYMVTLSCSLCNNYCVIFIIKINMGVLSFMAIRKCINVTI